MRLLLLPVVCVLAAASAAFAQTDAERVVRNEAGLTVTANSHQVTLPVPAWMENTMPGDDVSAAVDVFRQIMPGGELVELIAPDQDADSWTHKTSAFLMNHEAFPADMHIKLVVSAFQQNCIEDKLRFQVLQPAVEGGEPVALLVCAQFNNGEEAGEVMAVTIVQSEAATARIYVEWRGPAFDADESETWPVSSVADLRDTIARLSGGAAITLPAAE